MNYLLLMIHSCAFALKRENNWAASRGYQGERIYCSLPIRVTFKFEGDGSIILYRRADTLYICVLGKNVSLDKK